MSSHETTKVKLSTPSSFDMLLARKPEAVSVLQSEQLVHVSRSDDLEQEESACKTTAPRTRGPPPLVRETMREHEIDADAESCNNPRKPRVPDAGRAHSNMYTTGDDEAIEDEGTCPDGEGSSGRS